MTQEKLQWAIFSADPVAPWKPPIQELQFPKYFSLVERMAIFIVGLQKVLKFLNGAWRCHNSEKRFLPNFDASVA